MSQQWISPRGRGRSLAARLVTASALGLMTALSPAAELEPKDVLNLSPEDLGKLQVTSVSRRPELLSEAAASVYVITAEDIRRSPATTLTEVLRLAPTLFVAFDNGIPGYVSARGQASSPYAGGNKLLVLIDGRSVYSPFFSGVFWDAQVPVLADIDRIEVISGPAGVLWGVNAVNGVINIITKNAAQTQGWLAQAGAGDRARDGVLRYGSSLGDYGHYRVYGQVNERGSSIREIDSGRIDDNWRKTSTGGRLDWQHGEHAFSGQFNALSGDQGQPSLTIIPADVPPPPFPRVELGAFNALGRWTHTPGDGSNLAVQMYFDNTSRRMQPTLNLRGNIFDLEVQKNEAAHGAHKLTWGGNLRFYRENTTNSASVGFFPPTVTQRWLSMFVQDEISLTRKLRLTAGTRVERGAFGTTDLLPSLRLAQQTGEGQLVWGGLSRTVRGPTRLDTDFRVTAAPGGLDFIGNRDFQSERVKVAELGYRYQGRVASASVTLYKNYYDRLGTIILDSSGTFLTTGNFVSGQAKGIEAWGDLRVTPAWRLSAGLAVNSDRYDVAPGILSVPIDAYAGTSPTSTLQLRSSWNLPYRTELDVVYRHVSFFGDPNDPLNQNLAPFVPPSNAIDIRFGWKLNKQLDLDVIGQNLFGTRHAEFGDPSVRAIMTQRIYTRLTWRQ